jgi:DNA gyrase subunit A
MRVTEKNGPVMGCRQVAPTDEVMLVSSHGKLIRTKVEGISEQGRITQGVRVIALEDGEKVVAIEHIVEAHPDLSV